MLVSGPGVPVVLSSTEIETYCVQPRRRAQTCSCSALGELAGWQGWREEASRVGGGMWPGAEGGREHFQPGPGSRWSMGGQSARGLRRPAGRRADRCPPLVPEQPPASSLVPPTIEGAGGEPRVVKAVAGRPLALECVARGHPPPTLSWHREGLPVAESNETWLEAGGSVLSLERLGEASGGPYSCVASSPAGEAVLQYSVEVQGALGTVPPLSHPGCGPLFYTHCVGGPAAPGGCGVVKAQHPRIARDRRTHRPGLEVPQSSEGAGLSPRIILPAQGSRARLLWTGPYSAPRCSWSTGQTLDSLRPRAGLCGLWFPGEMGLCLFASI